MQILYTNFHRSAGVGGHTIYIMSLIQSLVARHDITVAAPMDSGLHRRARALDGVHVVAQDFPNRPHHAWAASRQLRAVITQRNIQLIHVNGSADHRLVMMATLGMGARKPAIVFTKHNDQRIKPLSAAVRAFFGTDHVIAVCDFVRRRVDATPYRRKGVTTIPNGIDTAHYARDALMADSKVQAQVFEMRAQWLGQKQDAQKHIVFGSQAGTDDYKGWMDLVTAVASLPLDQRACMHIALAGAWPSEKQKAEVHALGMSAQVHFTGPLDDVRPFLAALDIGFVLSWRVETISFACREMMGMGVPVIVSDHGGLPENITNGVDGWIVPARELPAIAVCVQAILANPERIPIIAAAARERAQNTFGLDKFVAATEAVYQALVSKARRS